VRRMKTRNENEKQRNQVTDTLNVQLDVNDLARYGEFMSPATIKGFSVLFKGFPCFRGFSVLFEGFPCFFSFFRAF